MRKNKAFPSNGEKNSERQKIKGGGEQTQDRDIATGKESARISMEQGAEAGIVSTSGGEDGEARKQLKQRGLKEQKG